MGGIGEALIILSCGVTLAAMACFCAMAGYLFACFQRAIPLLESMDKSLASLLKSTSELVDSPPLEGIPPLGPGVYLPEQVEGLTRLRPLTDDKRG